MRSWCFRYVASEASGGGRGLGRGLEVLRYVVLCYAFQSGFVSNLLGLLRFGEIGWVLGMLFLALGS